MEIPCEKCGHINTVNGLGRKKKDIPVEIVYNACQYGLNSRGRLSFEKVANYLSKKLNDPSINRGNISDILKREAARRGKTRQELIDEILLPVRNRKRIKEAVAR